MEIKPPQVETPERVKELGNHLQEYAEHFKRLYSGKAFYEALACVAIDYFEGTLPE